MLNLTGGDFRFVASEPASRERLGAGWHDYNSLDFVVREYEKYGEEASNRLISDADLVINAGAVWGNDALKARIKSGKVTMIYSERPFKKPWTPYLFFKRTASTLLKYVPYDRRNVYFLAASAYASSDFRKYGVFRRKSFKWGYFPPLYVYDDFDGFFDKKVSNRILWCARLIEWKRPITALRVAKTLKGSGHAFVLRMIGDGPLRKGLEKKAKEMGIDDVVEFAGSMDFRLVRQEMEQAGIFLFTSNRQEGWGAVMNEAMNAGCAVVSCNAAGAAPFLIKNGENGCLFNTDDVEMAAKLVSRVLRDDEKRRALSLAAYRTIQEEWNSDVAAKRLLVLFDAIRSGRDLRIYGDGPCSPDF